LLVKRGDHLSIFATSAAIDREYDAPVDAFESVLDAVRQSTPCVIVDIPHVWTPWVKATLIGADDIVIVATPDLASLRNAKNLVEILRANRPNDTPPRLVINQVGVAKRPEIPAKDFAETIGLEPALVLPFDPQIFGNAANNGQMINELSPKSPIAGGVRRLAELVTGRVPQPLQKASPFLSFLKGKKRA
jgi:pilus assembly protein CpaE